MHLSIETVTEQNKEEMISFLIKHDNFSMYLLGNIELYGLTLQDSPYSGNYKLIRQDGHIATVFYLSRKGSLLIVSDLNDPVFPMVLEACKEEPINFKGVVGNSDFCIPFWEYIKAKNLIKKETFTQKYVLYSLTLENTNFSVQNNVRALTEADYLQWEPLRLAYIKEEGLPNDITDKQRHDLYLSKVKKQVSWGLFLNDTLISMADLSSNTSDLGQVGGVYTLPEYRRKGYSRAVMQHLINDCKENHKIGKLIIYTSETSFAAQDLYKSLGCKEEGFYTLLFGSSENS